eukprot:1156255-Pelagomonas_calceolata.AAC.1
MCLCSGRSWLGCRTLEAGGVAVAGPECSLFPLRPPLLLNGATRREPLFVRETMRENVLGRVLVVECSGICRFCKARQSALPMSMEARTAPRGPLLTLKGGFCWQYCGA